MFKPHKKRTKRTSKMFLSIIILLILAGTTVYVKGAEGPVSKDNYEKKTVTIPASSSTREIAKILKDNDLIVNELVFNIYSKVKGNSPNYKAGVYELNTFMDQESIMKELVKGGKEKNIVKFTIPEGFELNQIAQRLEKAKLIDKQEFLALTSNTDEFKENYDFLKDIPEDSTLEGYLYPATYEVFENVTEKEIILKMLDAFDIVYKNEIEPVKDNLEMDTNQIITLASIIEREAVLEEERYIMSGVFYNRLKVDMPLQSCATVQYALGERKPVLSNKDVQIESNYNTYINTGLPPAPISSPGTESIKAAVKPSDIDYLFFVRTGDDGSHTFTETYNEHLKAKNRE